MKTNSIRHTATKEYNNGENKITVKIRLNDECNNGHQDFSITATLFEKNGKRFENVGGGCCHDEILKVFPQFKIFVDLHLCDYLGNPMYAVENGFFHLKEGMREGTNFADYYSMTAEQYKKIKLSESKEHYNYLLRSTGVVKGWRAKAKQAIEELEKMTRKTFEVDSVRTNFVPNALETDTAILKLIADGYYSKKNKETRKEQAEEDKKNETIQKLRERANEDIKKIQTELTVKLYIIECGLNLDNFIYYNHTNKGVFNWMDSRDKLSESEFNHFCETLDFNQLPDGIKFELKGVIEYSPIK
jgi:hypothetical protein